MLAYILALAVALGSLAIYLAAFFFPEVHRKSDFIWGGVGLFYALVLWVCAGRITGGVLLGQTASVALLGWFGWQTLTLRRGILPDEQQTAIPSQGQLSAKLAKLSLLQPVTSFFTTVKEQIQQTLSRFTQRKAKPELEKTQKSAAPQPSTDVAAKASQVEPATSAKTGEVATDSVPEPVLPHPTPAEPAKKDSVPEAVPPHPPSAELVEEAQASPTATVASVPIEEIAPEVELAPPAEPNS